MNDTDRLLAIARRIAAVHAREPGVAVVLVTGSVARGWADRWSDLELLVAWNDVPACEARRSILAPLGATSWQSFDGDEDETWLDSTKIDLFHRRIGDVDQLLDRVTVNGDPDPEAHVSVAALRDALSLHGHDLAIGWRERARQYPEALRVRMVVDNLLFGPHWWLRMLAERGDALALHELLVRIARALLGIMLALNRQYALSTSLKWSLRVAGDLTVAPNRFAPRLQALLRMEPGRAVDLAVALIDETLDLIAGHLPSIDLTTVRRRLATPRVTAP